MKATNKTDAIAEFLEVCSKSNRSLDLNWDHRETFFDSEVQSVLSERHPSVKKYTSQLQFSYPIVAWNTADQFLWGTNKLDQTEIDALDFTRGDGEWYARLTVKVRAAWEKCKKRKAHPETVLDKFLQWRLERFFLETSKVSPKPPPMKYQEAVEYIFPGQKFEDTDQPLNAIRQAVFRENKRRDAIMEKWAECWLIHIRGTYTPESSADIRAAQTGQPVTKTPPNK